jgi:hypothetical protein
MHAENYNAAKNFSSKTFDPKILLKKQPGRPDPWARAFVSRPFGDVAGAGSSFANVRFLQ